ncbi:hypothetical protein F5B19DRAFT_453541 [Rostrohypoxylon terebratum]|nr:hypothetical protein F5B19DRAFT_453541 [Rostrohypoxylon terebratum]
MLCQVRLLPTCSDFAIWASLLRLLHSVSTYETSDQNVLYHINLCGDWRRGKIGLSCRSRTKARPDASPRFSAGNFVGSPWYKTISPYSIEIRPVLDSAFAALFLVQ